MESSVPSYIAPLSSLPVQMVDRHHGMCQKGRPLNTDLSLSLRIFKRGNCRLLPYTLSIPQFLLATYQIGGGGGRRGGITRKEEGPGSSNEDPKIFGQNPKKWISFPLAR